MRRQTSVQNVGFIFVQNVESVGVSLAKKREMPFTVCWKAFLVMLNWVRVTGDKIMSDCEFKRQLKRMAAEVINENKTVFDKLSDCTNGHCEVGINPNRGKHGFFLRCDNCKTVFPLTKQLNDHMFCPKCHGDMLVWDDRPETLESYKWDGKK